MIPLPGNNAAQVKREKENSREIHFLMRETFFHLWDKFIGYRSVVLLCKSGCIIPPRMQSIAKKLLCDEQPQKNQDITIYLHQKLAVCN